MNILFLSNRDLASNFALNRLLPNLSVQHDVHLWLSAKVGKSNDQPEPLKRLKFFEQDLFNQLLSPAYSKIENPLKYKSFTQFNRYLSSALKEVNKINSPEALASVQSLAPDLIVSIRYGGILKEDVIAIPSLGVINLHSGILPKYKGVMATFWAMLNKDSEIGTTLHTIDDSSIDTGKIIKVSKFGIVHNKSYLWHVLELYKQGTDDILSAINKLILDKSLPTCPQPKSEPYFTFPTIEELSQFEREGSKIVDEQDYMEFIKKYYM